MRLIRRHFQLILSIFSMCFTAKAKYGNPDLDNNTTLQTSLEHENIFIDACRRFEYLEQKINLSLEEIDEINLLEEIIGIACTKPNEYEVSSVSHLIKGL